AETGPYSVPHSVLLSALSDNIYPHKLDQEIGRIQQKYEIPDCSKNQIGLLRTGRIDDQEDSEALVQYDIHLSWPIKQSNVRWGYDYFADLYLLWSFVKHCFDIVPFNELDEFPRKVIVYNGK
nr:maturase, mitochondrial [Tanacetum cinerariifolium]GFB18396.1 maturase, mitochondrial [Tanacetum cinerariifolium]